MVLISYKKVIILLIVNGSDTKLPGENIAL